MRNDVNRRHFLTGRVSPMAVASAIVSVVPGRLDDLVSALATLPGTEVAAAEGCKIVVVLEGHTRDELGARLAHIAMMEGVIVANMVFEHADSRDEMP